MDFQGSVAGGAGSESVALSQRIESVCSFSGETITLSFWAKSDTVGPHTIALGWRQRFGTGGGASAAVSLAAQEITTLTNTWQFFSLTFSIASISGKTIGTSGTDSLALRIFTQAAAGALGALNVPNPISFTDTVSFANVQVELGATGTAFEIKELETVVGLCQRYFCKNQSLDQVPDTSDTGEAFRMTLQFFNDTGFVMFPSTMRAPPTVTTFVITSTGIAATSISDSSAVFQRTGGSQTSGSWNWTADAEL